MTPKEFSAFVDVMRRKGVERARIGDVEIHLGLVREMLTNDERRLAAIITWRRSWSLTVRNVRPEDGCEIVSNEVNLMKLSVLRVDQVRLSMFCQPSIVLFGDDIKRLLLKKTVVAGFQTFSAGDAGTSLG